MQSVQVRFDYPDRLSRGLLLLRFFFGWLYVGIPHFFCLFFVGFVAGICSFVAWFAVLFTGKYPKGLFDFVTGTYDWGLRVAAYFGNFRDEYPAFGLKADYPVSFSVTYPEKLSRGLLLLRTLFGWIYIYIPHCFCLCFRLIGHSVVAFIAWWAILFTGKMPQSMFNFLTGTFRWIMNVNAYTCYLTDEYPPFSGKPAGAAAAGKGVAA